MNTLSLKKYIAEAIGTGTLTFAVLASLTMDLPLATPLLAGATLGLFVYIFGGLSGTHINPAVTIGLWSIGKINIKDAIGYIVFQVAAAFAVSKSFGMIYENLPSVTANADLSTFVAESKGAGLLLLGICGVVFGKVSDGASGLVIGGSLALGALLAGTISNGVLNPAVAIGIGSVSWAYLLGPIVGAVVTCWIYRWLVQK